MMSKKILKNGKNIESEKFEAVKEIRDKFIEYWNNKGYGIGRQGEMKIESYLNSKVKVTTEITVKTSIDELNKLINMK